MATGSPVSGREHEITSGTAARNTPSSIASRNSFWSSSRSCRPVALGRARHGGGAVHEAGVRSALHVHDLPADQHRAAERLPTADDAGPDARRARRRARARGRSSRRSTAPRASLDGHSVQRAGAHAAEGRPRPRGRGVRPTRRRPGRSTSVLPRPSVSTTGPAAMPARCIACRCSPENARPMPSASTSGRPRRAAQVTGSSPFAPPTSKHMSAPTRRPAHGLDGVAQHAPSSPLQSRSVGDRGRADRAARHARARRRGSSSSATSATGPCSSTARSAISRARSVSPPPPAPSTAQPRASCREVGRVEALRQVRSPARTRDLAYVAWPRSRSWWRRRRSARCSATSRAPGPTPRSSASR